jgi:hypothetical protein
MILYQAELDTCSPLPTKFLAKTKYLYEKVDAKNFVSEAF